MVFFLEWSIRWPFVQEICVILLFQKAKPDEDTAYQRLAFGSEFL